MSAIVLLMYAPILFLAGWLCCRRGRRWRPDRLAYLSVAVVYLPLPWFVSSLGGMHFTGIPRSRPGLVLLFRTPAPARKRLGIGDCPCGRCL